MTVSTDHVPATYRLLVSVRGGLHAGAAYVGDAGQIVRIGSSPDCDLVLMDDGVAAEALSLSVVEGTLLAEVTGPGVMLGAQPLAAGRVAFDEPAARLQIGQASLSVELLRRSSRGPQPGRVAPPTDGPRIAVPPGHSAEAPRRGWRPALTSGVLVACVLAAGGAAVSASYHHAPTVAAAPLLAGIVAQFNERGAALALTERAAGGPVVRGLVADATMRADLERTLAGAGLRATLQVQDARTAGDSLDRLARLAGHACDARHEGGGHYACVAALPDAERAEHFRQMAASVPGVQSLALRSLPPPVPTVPVVDVPEPQPPAAVPPPVRLDPPHPQIRHVAIGPNGGLAIDARGRTLRVGDQVDGARVLAVRFNGLDLVYAGQRYSVGVNAALGDAESGRP